jgi:hypothetical protein
MQELALRGLRKGAGLIPILCKEFLSARSVVFFGPPPAEGGRRPHAEAAASPQGWPPPKKKVYNGKWYYTILRPRLS